METVTDALVMRNFGEDLRVERVVAKGPAPDEVLVEIAATGICHSDLLCMSGNLPFPTPTILGHEAAGTVAAVGTGLLGSYSVGDQVILTFDSCGDCNSCKTDHPAYCHDFTSRNAPSDLSDDGKPRLHMATPDASPVWGKFFGQSSFARYALVSSRSIINITASCGLALPREELQYLAPLGCGVQTGFGSVMNSLGVTAGSSLAVFGAGAVGLSAIMAAKAVGASIIIAIDLVESRLALAKELGATHVLLNSGTTLAQDVKDIAPVDRGVRFAIDTTGVSSVIEAMVQSLGLMGKALSVGMAYANPELKIDINQMIMSGQSYLGCIEGDSVPDKIIPRLVEEYRNGRLPVDKMARMYPYTECNRAIADMRSGKTVKPILVW
ncbi:chaperonin 10-like protein [Aspergillus avenaceus]|uniref:Chaperonin 10-like protein n=1 Tax=Aspergillus avenaceus TaxID=36643 RepID=A0A5N6U962_ASPAV|nr:chaperonin 10-like protein [Aspergillus avenaceus]